MFYNESNPLENCQSTGSWEEVKTLVLPGDPILLSNTDKKKTSPFKLRTAMGTTVVRIYDQSTSVIKKNIQDRLGKLSQGLQQNYMS